MQAWQIGLCCIEGLPAALSRQVRSYWGLHKVLSTVTFALGVSVSLGALLALDLAVDILDGVRAIQLEGSDLACRKQAL